MRIMKTEKITLTDGSEINVGSTWTTIDNDNNRQSYAEGVDGELYKVVDRNADGAVWDYLYC